MKKFFSILGIVLCLVMCSALFIILTNDYGDNSNNGNNYNTTITTPIDFSNKTYIAFGDSITFGADYTRGYAQMDNPYSELVASTLGMKSYKNAGVSGATLCSNTLGLACISDIVANTSASYDVISLLGGVNDFNRGLPLGNYGDTTNTTIYGSLDVIATHLTTNFSNSFIFFMTPYREFWGGVHCSTPNSQGYNLEDVATAVKQIANKYSIPVLDLFNNGQFELEMYNSDSDGLHPSQSFITNYTAPQIAQFIKDNYKK